MKKYILVNATEQDIKERDVTESVDMNNGVQGYYHAVLKHVKEYVEHTFGRADFKLYKEIDGVRELIFKIP
jgi:hypothetical protein